MIVRLTSGILDENREDEAEERERETDRDRKRGERDSQRDTNPKRGTVSGQSCGREIPAKVQSTIIIDSKITHPGLRVVQMGVVVYKHYRSIDVYRSWLSPHSQPGAMV